MNTETQYLWKLLLWIYPKSGSFLFEEKTTHLVPGLPSFEMAHTCGNVGLPLRGLEHMFCRICLRSGFGSETKATKLGAARPAIGEAKLVSARSNRYLQI